MVASSPLVLRYARSGRVELAEQPGTTSLVSMDEWLHGVAGGRKGVLGVPPSSMDRTHHRGRVREPPWKLPCRHWLCDGAPTEVAYELIIGSVSINEFLKPSAYGLIIRQAWMSHIICYNVQKTGMDVAGGASAAVPPSESQRRATATDPFYLMFT